jgi:hypothetical protein
MDTISEIILAEVRRMRAEQTTWRQEFSDMRVTLGLRIGGRD